MSQLAEDHQPLIGDAITGDTPGLLIVIEKFPEADVVDGHPRHRSGHGRSRAGPRRTSRSTPPSSDRPRSSRTPPGKLGWAALAGLLLARAWSSGSGWARGGTRWSRRWPCSCSGTAAALTLQATGAVMNTMTLAGLALALTVAVGDAVADLDSLRTRGRTPRPPGDTAEPTPDGSVAPADAGAVTPRIAILTTALRRSRIPVLFGALISAVAIAPSFFVPGLDGEILPALAIAYLVTLGIAMIVALTVTPALASLLLRRKDDTEAANEPAAVEGMTTRYSETMERASAGRGGWIAALVARRARRRRARHHPVGDLRRARARRRCPTARSWSSGTRPRARRTRR